MKTRLSPSQLLVGAVFVVVGCKHGSEEGKAEDKTPAASAEIKIGQTMPYSGPASAYGTIGKVEAAYFQKLNKAGGINGHPINFISVDDGYSPPKAVEQVRKLVEQDQVLFIFQSLGTPSNAAIQPYLNGAKVPQLFVATGATRWSRSANTSRGPSASTRATSSKERRTASSSPRTRRARRSPSSTRTTISERTCSRA